MAPRAEIWVPPGVTQVDVEKTIGLGGRVLKFRELAPVDPGAVTSQSLIAFLEDQNPDLKFSSDTKERAHFKEPFKVLRTLPLEERRDLLVDFLTQGVNKFSNGEELGKYLAWINGFSWFVSGDRESVIPRFEEDVTRATREFYRRLNLEPLPVELFDGDIVFGDGEAHLADNQPWDKVQDAIRRVAMTNNRGGSREAAWDMAWSIPTAPAFDPDVDKGLLGKIVNAPRRIAANSACWIVVSDLMEQNSYDKGNPLEPLTAMIAFGYWPIGEITNRRGEKAFAILKPELPKQPVPTPTDAKQS